MQWVMERTGHWSLEGVRSYNMTSNAQREALPNIPNQWKQLCPVTNSLASLPAMPITCAPQQPSIPQYTASASISAAMLTTSQHQQQLVSGLSLQFTTIQNCTVDFYTSSDPPTDSRNTTIHKRRPVCIVSDSDSDCMYIHTQCTTSYIIPVLVQMIIVLLCSLDELPRASTCKTVHTYIYLAAGLF